MSQDITKDYLKWFDKNYGGGIKKLKNADGTWYDVNQGVTLKDANNNIVPATITKIKPKIVYGNPSMLPKLAEWQVYGNEQQGRFLTKYPEELSPTYYGMEVTEDIKKGIFKRQLGKKAYELKDHLGNVRVTFSDIKMPTGIANPQFEVDLLSKSEYFPYGMKINDLSYNQTGARYGYNGTHEQELAINPDGNHLDFGNFGFDTRVAMRRNQEPLRAKYPNLSGYSAFGSNPIKYSDLDGNDLKIVYRKPQTYGFFDPGHIAIAIINIDKIEKTGYKITNGWSFTPKDNNLVNGIFSFGGVDSRQANLQSDIKDATEIIDIKTNQKFDKILSNLIDERKLGNEEYDLDDNNCGQTVTELINKSLGIYGVNIKLEINFLPSNTKDEMKNNKKNIELELQKINKNLNPDKENIDKINETTKETELEGQK